MPFQFQFQQCAVTLVKEEGRHLRYLTCRGVSRELAQKFSPEGEKISAALKRATRAHVAIRCDAVKAAAHLDLEQSVRVQRIRSELVYFRWPGEGQQTSSSRKADGARTRRLER